VIKNDGAKQKLPSSSNALPVSLYRVSPHGNLFPRIPYLAVQHVSLRFELPQMNPKAAGVVPLQGMT